MNNLQGVDQPLLGYLITWLPGHPPWN